MPPKSPDHPESDSAAPYKSNPDHKAGEFIENDLWDLDDSWASDTPASDQDKEGSAAPTTPALHPIPPAPAKKPPAPAPQSSSTPAPEPEPAPPAPEPEATEEKPTSEPLSETPPSETPVSETQPGSPAAARRTLKPVERISLAAVAVFLLATLGFGLKIFFDQIPTRELGLKAPDFPVEGQRITIKDAESFWRDTGRSDAILVPVIELAMEGGGNGAIRVLFRNDEGSLVGDSVTCSFASGRFSDTGEPKTQIAATSGFKEMGGYAAYQTGESDLWSIEIYEGPEPRAPLSSFHLLFKMPVSTERR